MTTTMTTLAVTAARELTTIEVPVPECGPGEVLVKVAYCGICGSDVPRYFDGAVHSFPQVLGHEFSGTIAAIGDGVTGLNPGDRVTVAPLVPCHDCPQCRAGRPSLCPRYSFIGSRRPGAMAEYVLAPAVNVVPVGALDLRLAALVEPLTVALHAVDRVQGERPQHAAVLGGGVIGLMAVLALRERGAERITVVDINPGVLDVARNLGATDVIDSRDGEPETLLQQGAPDAVLETAGVAATRGFALDCAAKNGQIVLVGTPSGDLMLEPGRFESILRKELTLRGSWMSYSAPFPGSEWRRAPRLLADVPEVSQLITHEFPLVAAAQGLEAMRAAGGRRLKVMFGVGVES